MTPAPSHEQLHPAAQRLLALVTRPVPAGHEAEHVAELVQASLLLLRAHVPYLEAKEDV